MSYVFPLTCQSPREARKCNYISQIMLHEKRYQYANTKTICKPRNYRQITSTWCRPKTIKFNSVLKFIQIPFSDFSIISNISNGTNCPLVFKTCRRWVFQQLHELSHPRTWATGKTIAGRFIWPKIKAGVKRWTRNHMKCHCSIVPLHTLSFFREFPLPEDASKTYI